MDNEGYIKSEQNDQSNILVLGNNFNGCLLTRDIEDRTDFTEIKNKLLDFYRSFKIKCGLKSCVLYGKSNKLSKDENCDEFFLWGRFSSEEFENIDIEKSCFPFSYKNFPLKNKISNISCGDNHILIVDNIGNLFSMGKGDHGELGLGENNIITNTPTKIINFYQNKDEISKTDDKFINCFAGMRTSFVITSKSHFYY